MMMKNRCSYGIGDEDVVTMLVEENWRRDSGSDRDRAW